MCNNNYNIFTQIFKEDGENCAGSSDHCVLIGTASKGIIERDQQHNVQVYRHLYASNPFTMETDDKIQKYLREVEIKSRSTSALEQFGKVIINPPRNRNAKKEDRGD